MTADQWLCVFLAAAAIVATAPFVPAAAAMWLATRRRGRA